MIDGFRGMGGVDVRHQKNLKEWRCGPAMHRLLLSKYQDSRIATTPRSKYHKAFIDLVDLQAHSNNSRALQVVMYSLLSGSAMVGNSAGEREQIFPG